FNLVALPLLSKAPDGLIATEVAAPFLVPVKLAFYFALIIAMPVILYQLWAFVAPGLYKNERRLIVPLMLTSLILFYLGALFSFFVILPVVFGFFVSIVPESVTVMPDMARYLKFVFVLCFAFGLSFEIPIATVLLVRTGVTTPAKLRKKRAYVLLGAFVVGMLLTPPDAISQTLLAIPVYVLFELGIILSQWWVPGHREVEQQQLEQANKPSGPST
ncbi:MAG: twin-arginine translocase subunit TatC, partial [Gammaproteobacteria bacterium]|nr:twin-arginine translocase subunit TatC [Gammaproteobacteria bacterium]